MLDRGLDCAARSRSARLALSRGETDQRRVAARGGAVHVRRGLPVLRRLIATKIFAVDDRRATPAVRLDDGRDYLPTNRWIVFGHHFAAIAGPGPLVGPTLAAQFGFLPGAIWIIVGVVLGGAVQDLVILLASVRRERTFARRRWRATRSVPWPASRRSSRSSAS